MSCILTFDDGVLQVFDLLGAEQQQLLYDGYEWFSLVPLIVKELYRGRFSIVTSGHLQVLCQDMAYMGLGLV